MADVSIRLYTALAGSAFIYFFHLKTHANNIPTVSTRFISKKKKKFQII